MRRADLSPLSQLMRRVDAAVDGSASNDGISTGFPSADKLLGGGVRRGDLVVIGGEVGSGKSAFALAIALRAAQAEKSAAFYSGEMTVPRVLERTLAIEGRVRIDDIRRGALDEATRASVGAAAVRLRDAQPTLDVVPSGGPDALADELRRHQGLQLVIVDPLTALVGGVRDQEEELATAVRRLKMLAMETDTAVIVTAPLSISTRERRDPRPMLEDFGALGAIRQTADVVLGLFREEMYQGGQQVEGATELIALKNRNGATGYVDLYFYKQWLRFEDMLDPDR